MDNPAWNQDLLDWLAVDFVQNGYDLKHTMTLMLTSQAYLRPAVPLDPDGGTEKFVFQGPMVKRMSAEQFLDALEQIIVAANANSDSDSRRGTGRKRTGLSKIDHLKRTLGRTKRDVVVTRRESTATTAQLIELSNGRTLAETLTRGSKAWLETGKESAAIVDASLPMPSAGRPPIAKNPPPLKSSDLPLPRRESKTCFGFLPCIPNFN